MPLKSNIGVSSDMASGKGSFGAWSRLDPPCCNSAYAAQSEHFLRRIHVLICGSYATSRGHFGFLRFIESRAVSRAPAAPQLFEERARSDA